MDEDWDYESGPYCPHWGEPGYCDEICKDCGHVCGKHLLECVVDGCTCENFEDKK